MHPVFIEFLGTPEAGKTTTVYEVKNLLVSQGYHVGIIDEAIQNIFQQQVNLKDKLSVEAHMASRLRLIHYFYDAYFSGDEIIIADRGLYDAFFWNELYFKRDVISSGALECYNKMFNYHKDNMSNNIYIPILLTVTIDESLRRHGHEGRIVNRKFLTLYNSTLDEFKNSLPSNSISIDTTSTKLDDVISTIADELKIQLHNNH